MSHQPIINAMTVDVEDYFQVSAFESHIDRDDWGDKECRVERNMDRILALFDSHSVKATFFTLGWLAEKYPNMVRRIVEEGHELASHGWDHQRVTGFTPEAFFQDVSRTKAVLEDVGGVEISGYRAPSYSICEDNLWAFETLVESGHVYSSSVVPIQHDHYGMQSASRFAFSVADGKLAEIPVTTYPVMGKNINFGGGGWFRFFPYALTRWALQQVNVKEQQACNFYFHPWEVDPEQPRVGDIPIKTKFRHYINLARMEPRLDQLLGDFAWGRMDEVFAQEIAAARKAVCPA